MPMEFVAWQFVFWRPRIMDEDAETAVIKLLIYLLEELIRLESQTFDLPRVPRRQVEAIVSQVNEHAETIHDAVVYVYRRLGKWLPIENFDDLR